MEEFNNLPRTRRPRQYTYRGSYRRPGSIPGGFNPAADVLSAIEEVEGKFVKRRKDIDLFEQQAMQRRLNLQKMVDDTKTMDENPFKSQMTQEFSQMVDDLYRADIESFDGDRAGYMEKANNAQKAIGDFQKVVGLLDADVNEYKDKSPAELKKLVLRSQFMGKDGMKREDYLAFLNDPGKMGMRIQNGELIITNNGKDLFNGTRYLNSKKDGYSLVEYGNDYTKEIGAAAKDAMQGVGDLEIIRQYEKLSEDGKKLTGFTDVDYRKAVEAYRDNLMKSDKIDALVNESTFQRYTTNRDVYNADKHTEETKTAIIDDLVKKQFPTAYRTKKVVSKLVTQKNGKDEEEEKTPETVTYTEILKPAEKLKSLLQNPNQGTRSKELVTEENKMRFEALSDSEKKAKEALENSLNNRFFGQNFGTQSNPVIIAKGEIAVNDKGELMYFPKYNKTTKGVTDLVTIESYNNGIPLTEDFLFRFEKKLNKVIGEDVKLQTKPKFTTEDITKINEAKKTGGKVQLSDGKTYTIKKTK